MKKLLLISLTTFLFGFTSKYTPDINNFVKDINCSQVLKNTKYDVCYDYSRKDPFYTAYDINKSYLEGKKYKRPTYFKSDKRIPKKYRSYNNNISGKEFEKGHNTPNDIFSRNKKLQKETFIMSNVAPQNRNLNRGLWGKIEKFVRVETLRYNSVEVITGNCGNKGYMKRKVAIPEYWYKIVYIPKLNKTLIFLAPNQKLKDSKMKDYLVDYKTLKEKCNF